MNRRESLLGLAALGAASFARAQSAANPARIMSLAFGRRPEVLPARGAFIAAFVQRLRELGYIEGKDIVVETYWTAGGAGDVPDLAKALEAFKPEVILAQGETSARAAQRATAAIPIVMTYSGDPVAGGFAKSLARPGGNITGLATLNMDTSPKLLELLLGVMPKLPGVAVLGNPSIGSYASVLKNLQDAARSVNVSVLSIEASSAAEIESGFARMAREKARAVVVLGDPLVFTQRRQIADLALKHRMASVFPAREHVDAGGLMSYGASIVDNYRRAASFVDRILKGAKPGELPIEQVTTLELVINLRTAKALGITFPQSVLLRAGEVIE